jgi:predicted O-methyltransferase YrrM
MKHVSNRIELAEYLNELGFKKGAEVGVFGGYYSEILCKAIPGLDLTCVDVWGWGKYQRAEEECLERLKPYNVNIIKKYSVEAAKEVADGSLDFVYIDAAHDYENVKLDIAAWAPKVRVGGIIAGDDFYDFPSGKGGVMRAATEYTSHHHYDLKLTDWNINNPIRDDRMPNFWFVKNHDDGPQHPHEKENFNGFKNI